MKCNNKPLRECLTALQIAAVSYLSKIQTNTDIVGIPNHPRYNSSKEIFISTWIDANSFIFKSKGVEYTITLDGREFSTPKNAREFSETSKNQEIKPKNNMSNNDLFAPIVEHIKTACINDLQREVEELKNKFNSTPSASVIKVEGCKDVKIKGTLHPAFSDILTYLKGGENVYLYGPAGAGKNYLGAQLAQALQVDFYYQNTILTKFDLSGFVDARGEFQETEFFKAWTQGGLFFCDELDNSTAEAIIALNAALANGYFTFPKHGKVEKHTNFYCVAAGNTNGLGATDEYCGRYQMDESSRDRFIFKHIDYDIEIESALCANDLDILYFVHALRHACATTGIKLIAGYRLITRLYKFSALYPVAVLKDVLLKGLHEDAIKELASYISKNTISKYATNKYIVALKEIANL